MDRREFLKKSAAVGAGGFVLSNRALEVGIKARRPNVLFVLADQWRYCSAGHANHPDTLVQTPNLDKLAEQGVRWSRCYSAHPLCTPNRAAIITGRFPHETGMIGNSLMLPPSERCIADVFGEAGYRTHYIGKWHMDGEAKPGFVPQNWRRRGFQTFVGFNRGHFYYDSPTFSDDGVRMSATGEYTPGQYEPTFQTDLAIDFIKQNKDRPFFCFLSWGPPHTPYNPPEGFDMYNSEDVVFRPNVVGGNRSSLANYFGLCTSLDHEFGRLMQTLKQLRLDDNTLIVFTSDHGDGHQSHGIAHKNEPEEESCHVPLIMRLPGRFKAGREAENLISSIDLMPTILSICSLQVPRTCTGKDKSAALLGQEAADESIYAEKAGDWRAVLMGAHKFVVESVDGVQTATKLFDLANDPYEMSNLVGLAQHGDLQARLLAELNAWKEKTDDPFPATPAKAKIMYDA
ncbi:MAG: sulfatase-like hydrolase/transferase [Phycisphaerae bacterium]|nr:sulfatase-like hydrolase/transferase [Phycisphaerae bacterium]